jgi:hydrogenase expression/formation protein HypD
MAMAREHGVVLTTFGDMMRVPASTGTLAELRSEGAAVEVVYSPMEALAQARKHPEEEVVFLAVGFETTAPAIAATVLQAHESRVENFSILSALKTMPPVLENLVESEELAIDGFLLPGHISMVLGVEPFTFLAEEFDRACVISGFEPADILQSVIMAAEMIERNVFEVALQYHRAVRPEGNVRAREWMYTVFESADTTWRGFGNLPGSGLMLRDDFEPMNANRRFPVSVEPNVEPEGCRCGAILRGLMGPVDCPLFARECTPESPVGACMVSNEGSCAAYFKYSRFR